MAVTDGKCPARLKGCAGISARAEDAPGGPRKPQEAPGGLRRPQEVAGSPMGPQEAQGGSRRPEEAPGGSRRLQEAQGGFRKPQGIPGGPRRIHEALGRPQDVPGDPGRPQGAPGARRIGERKMCAAPWRERNFQTKCARHPPSQHISDTGRNDQRVKYQCKGPDGAIVVPPATARVRQAMRARPRTAAARRRRLGRAAGRGADWRSRAFLRSSWGPWTASWGHLGRPPAPGAILDDHLRPEGTWDLPAPPPSL